jgi:hypothetical protein
MEEIELDMYTGKWAEIQVNIKRREEGNCN